MPRGKTSRTRAFSVTVLLGAIVIGLLPSAAMPASAEDRPQPPRAVADDLARQREVAVRRYAGAEQRRRAEVERSERSRQAGDAWREAELQSELTRREAARTFGKPKKAIVPAALPTPLVNLASCARSQPPETLVAPGVLVRIVGGGWTTKTRGLTQAFIKGATVEATVGGKVIVDAGRYFLDPVRENHPTLGEVWTTNWVYPLTPQSSPILVRLKISLDHQIVDLVAFDGDGEPVHHPAGFTTDLSCTLRPGLSIGGRITGEGTTVADGEVFAYETTTGLAGRAETNTSGEFSLVLGSGSYKFFFRSRGGPWVPEWWDDKQSYSEATAVVLGAGGTPP